MSKISIFGSWLGVLTLLGAVPVLHAAEEVTLTNGFNLLCDHREETGGKGRLIANQGNSNFVEVHGAEIASVDTVPDPPAFTAPNARIAEPKLTDADVHELISKAGASHNLDVD